MSATRLLRHACLSAIAVGSIATVSAGCLDRPVAPATPKTTSRVVDKETQSSVDKIDLLFMIDNSSSMADKQAVLADAVPDLVGRLVSPICVDGKGAPVGDNDSSDGCPQGALPEFEPIKDIHIGIVSSSLGGVGADSCSPAQQGFNPTMADMAHLITRGMNGTAPTYANKGFLQWDPDGKKSPPGENKIANLVSVFQDLVQGTGQTGCGFEASLEAVYRFLIDPDPYQSVSLNGGLASLDGTDQTVLQQRADFLRPDSLVSIISISDENDCSVIAGGQYYLALQASSGNAQFFLPRGTSACLTNPNDKCCVSCGQGVPPGCPDPSTDSECQKPPAQVDKDQALNLRCFHEKQRFGIDFLQPIQRYVDGITKTTVADRTGQTVDNPLYADLQCQDNTDCKPGRDPSLIFWAMIVGVPWQDIANDPTDLTKGYMTADQITSSGRWDVILGDPAASPPVDPADPLMIESITPRAGKNPITNDPIIPPGGTAWNPINGHEWDISSRNDDLQYACVFPFAQGQTKDCAANSGNCDCSDGPTTGNPLCAPFPTNGQAQGAATTTQYGAKGYPGTRHLQVLKGLGAQGIAASICPSNLADKSAADYGYRPAIGAIIDRLKEKLKGHCLPRILAPCHDSNDSCVPGVEEGQVPCAILEVTSSSDGTCNCDQAGHATPPAEYITPEVLASRPNACVCEIKQLSGQDLTSCQQDATLPASTQDGWCYVDPGQGSGNPELVAKCLPSQQRIIRFANNSGQTPANNSVVFYTCQEGAFNPAAGNNGGGNTPPPASDAGAGD